MPLLQVENLRTAFHTRNGVVRAVNDVSFHVEKGETLGIVGESGSGKSVTCYSLMGLIPQPPGRIEAGRAMFDGVDLLHCSKQERAAIRGRRVAMIFQDPMTSLNPYLRVGDQIIEPLMIHGGVTRQEAHRRALDALREVGIQDGESRLRAYPHQFSGGMRQRVMIAMALITNPELLIADEPTTSTGLPSFSSPLISAWSAASATACRSCTRAASSKARPSARFSGRRCTLTTRPCNAASRPCSPRAWSFIRSPGNRRI